MISDSLTALPVQNPQKNKKKTSINHSPSYGNDILVKDFLKSRFYLLISHKNPAKTPIQA